MKEEWLQLLILIAPFIYIPFVWDQLPNTIPTHWDLHGHPNGYSGKAFGTLVLPLMNLALAALLFFFSRIDPKALKMNLPATSLRAVRLLVTGLLFLVFCLTMAIALGTTLDLNVLFRFVMILFFLLLGNYLPTIQPNYFIGVRTPWTLEDPENWRKTHRLAGRLWVIASMITALLEVVLPASIADTFFYLYLGVIIIPPIAYSFWLFQQKKKQRSPEPS